MDQYKYLIRQLQTSDEAFSNDTKLSIYSAVLDGVVTAACHYVSRARPLHALLYNIYIVFAPTDKHTRWCKLQNQLL